MAANGFTTQNVNYYMTADGGFAWTVNYDLGFLSSVFLATIRIKLIGDTASASVRTTWETGIETIWNNKVFFSDGTQLYTVQINADFVSSGQNQTVTVHDASGRDTMTHWHTIPQGGVVAAHEFGHMLGNYDEYAGGGTHNGFTTTGTLMSDLTVAGFYNNGYFASIEAYAEGFSGSNLAEVAATVGGSGADALNGDGGMNGFYGFGSNDTINGRAGNDYMDGGDGFDTAVFSGNRSSYTATTLANGTVRVSGPDGTDTLVSIEQLQFGDMTIWLVEPCLVSINDVSVTEGNSGFTKVATFTVTRTGGTAAFNLNFATSDGGATVADGDYVANSGTLSFGTNVNTQTISVSINGDTKFESNETFFVNLSGATNVAVITDSQGSGTITNDDSAPETTVLGNGVSITDNDITPSLSDFTDFGSTTQGAAAVQHTFTVRNDGTSTLTTSELTLPAGFTLIEGLSASIAAGDSDAFTVQLDTASVGTKNGHITFTTNDSDEGSFNFFITGMITNATWPLFTDNNDLFSGLGSNGLLHALAGNDYLGVTGNLNQAFGDAGTDQLFLIGDQNQLYGSEGDDWVGVNGNNNALFGGAGNEVWIGASGMSNTLVGGDGGDALFAYGTGNGLYGEGDTDWLGVSGNSNALYGGAGNEWMGATGNSNYLLGGDGGDTLLSVGGNFVYGEAGNDWVGCSGNNNYLNGAQGNDCIAATGNGNTLDGGAGNDTLVAGAHAGDRFVFHPGYGMDSITNFSGHGAGGTDVIDLNGFGLNFATLRDYYMVDGPNVMIVIDAATTLTINGVTKGQLQADDFIF